MKIAIFHYHLNPGGVTRIVESQVISLQKTVPGVAIQVFAGAVENDFFFKKNRIPLHIIPDLNYLKDKNHSKNDLNKKINTLYKFVKEKLTTGTILHVHNLNLGKNPLLTLAFHQLLKEGYRIVNHAHDFSEDRPENYEFMNRIISYHFGFNLKEIMYPISEKYFIGVLNRYDYQRLLNYGFPESKIFLFPNPVSICFNKDSDKVQYRKTLLKKLKIQPDKSIITYPVRVIRRKNIGEFILLSVLFPHCRFLVTLPPKNPVEIVFYNEWKKFCQQQNVQVVFEAGQKLKFEEIISGSDYCITTSKQEGFGMAYLEPWLMGTPVLGRNIQPVTDDIKYQGVEFPWLYDKIAVPQKNETPDFKDLDETEQREVIIRAKNDATFVSDLLTINKKLRQFPPKVKDDLVISNQKIIQQKFSIEQYGKRLYQTYKALL